MDNVSLLVRKVVNSLSGKKALVIIEHIVAIHVNDFWVKFSQCTTVCCVQV